MNLTDKPLICIECGAAFAFTTGEQQFFAKRGFTSEPRRCPFCRAVRRRERAAAGILPNHNDGTQERGLEARHWFTAVCDQCGHETQVPFQPRMDAPLFCSRCFRARLSLSR
jgi:CxxC-x17-CxxC domain-containing protein